MQGQIYNYGGTGTTKMLKALSLTTDLGHDNFFILMFYNILPHAYYRILESYLIDKLFQIKFKNEITIFRKTEAGILQGSVLGPILYLMYTSDLPTSDNTKTATFADDTAILVTHEDPAIASMKLQATINKINDLEKKWRIKITQSKSMHITFTIHNQTCLTVQMDNVDLHQKNEVKYLGMPLDRRLQWVRHIKTKRKQLNQKAKQMHWLLGRRSTISIEIKHLLYKAVLKPIWAYGIQLWGTASNFNIEILQRFQSKTVRSILNAP
jgi:hypothetical protein